MIYIVYYIIDEEVDIQETALEMVLLQEEHLHNDFLLQEGAHPGDHHRGVQYLQEVVLTQSKYFLCLIL